jgi:Zn-dependent protease
LLFSDPGIFLRLSLYRVPALLLTLCCHEWAHAYVAYRCGDPTARNMGRMTIDPRRHLDVMGTILMLTAGFGWAKPVPVNPRNYRNRIADDIKVSIAGITVNLILFLVFTALAVGLNGLLWHPELIAAIPEGPRAFLRLDGLNLMLVYGAEGYTDVLRNAWLAPVMAFITVAAQMNLMVAIFNLLPVPPLDGYHVVNDMLLRGRLHITPQIAQGGMLLLLVLSFATDILSQVMGFLGSNVQEGVLWIFLKLTGA